MEIRGVDQMCDAIRRLVVRGAPAIGVAAAMGIALGALQASDRDRAAFDREWDDVCSRIASTRPTAVNLFWAVERMKRVYAASSGS